MLLLGCGARTAPLVETATRDDAGMADTPVETTRDAALDGGIDAPMSACPPPSETGFRVEPGPLVGLGDWQDVALGGDGRTVATLLSAFDGTASLVIRTEEGERAHPITQLRSPQVSVQDGVVRVIGTNDGGRPSLYTATGLGELAEEAITVPTGALTRYDRPLWNGRDVIIAGTNLLGAVLVPWSRGGTTPAWFESASVSDALIAGDERGNTHLLTRATPGEVRSMVFDVGGTIVEGPLVLGDFPFRVATFGWSDDGLGQPWVVAGIGGSGPAGQRLIVSRYRRDGTAGGGFSAPLFTASLTGVVDLTTTPPLDHRHGYGVVVATGVDYRAFFHGAGEDFVGDSRELPMACDASRVSIASGPCGYVIACTQDGRVAMALAVPPRPR
jgi:hypothetical protein